jgi:hypothetical protein
MQTSNHDVIRQKIAKIEKQLASLKVQQAQAEATLSSLKEQLAITAEPTAPQSDSAAAAALDTQGKSGPVPSSLPRSGRCVSQTVAEPEVGQERILACLCQRLGSWGMRKAEGEMWRMP